MKYLTEYQSYENFTAVDMDLVEELYNNGITDPIEIQKELDYRELSLSTINQIIDILKSTNKIK